MKDHGTEKDWFGKDYSDFIQRIKEKHYGQGAEGSCKNYEDFRIG